MGLRVDEDLFPEKERLENIHGIKRKNQEGDEREKELRVLRSCEVTKWRARGGGSLSNRRRTPLPLRGRKAADILERVLAGVGLFVELRSFDLSFSGDLVAE